MALLLSFAVAAAYAGESARLPYWSHEAFVLRVCAGGVIIAGAIKAVGLV